MRTSSAASTNPSPRTASARSLMKTSTRSEPTSFKVSGISAIIVNRLKTTSSSEAAAEGARRKRNR